MPSGKTHDRVTLYLTVPVAAATYLLTRDWTMTLIVTLAMLFGGLMFGPDLDTQSVHYTRWGPLRFLWWPYKVALPHRSRFSHGIVFGTLIRIAYFLSVATVIVGLVLLIRDWFLHRTPASLLQVQDAFSRIWELLRPIRPEYLIAAFAGLWVGAASHTATDVLGSFFKSLKRSI